MAMKKVIGALRFGCWIVLLGLTACGGGGGGGSESNSSATNTASSSENFFDEPALFDTSWGIVSTHVDRCDFNTCIDLSKPNTVHFKKDKTGFIRHHGKIDTLTTEQVTAFDYRTRPSFSYPNKSSLVIHDLELNRFSPLAPSSSGSRQITYEFSRNGDDTRHLILNSSGTPQEEQTYLTEKTEPFVLPSIDLETIGNYETSWMIIKKIKADSSEMEITNTSFPTGEYYTQDNVLYLQFISGWSGYPAIKILMIPPGGANVHGCFGETQFVTYPNLHQIRFYNNPCQDEVSGDRQVQDIFRKKLSDLDFQAGTYEISIQNDRMELRLIEKYDPITHQPIFGTTYVLRLASWRKQHN